MPSRRERRLGEDNSPLAEKKAGETTALLGKEGLKTARGEEGAQLPLLGFAGLRGGDGPKRREAS